LALLHRRETLHGRNVNGSLPRGLMEACVFLVDLFRKQARGRTPYEGFEQIILCILVFIISVIIVYALILVIITVADDFRAGIVYMETGAMKDTFGLILTVIILLEFNHSIVLAIRQRSGAVQVRIIVLITIIVLARKLVLLDYVATSGETLLGLGGLALALGGLYWLISDREQPRRSRTVERTRLCRDRQHQRRHARDS
jgi:uncharacterized membrane protein (DUF373 family)